jgi:hypothetical protein
MILLIYYPVPSQDILSVKIQQKKLYIQGKRA